MKKFDATEGKVYPDTIKKIKYDIRINRSNCNVWMGVVFFGAKGQKLTIVDTWENRVLTLYH
jgi:hypothetical protein